MLIIIGAMHGNEPAGVKAVDLMGKMLEVEPITNPDFLYRGMVLGLIGNLEAYQLGQRFINRDLNRTWTAENIEMIRNTPIDQLRHEKREIKDILLTIEEEIEFYQPDKIVVLDLHTTSSYGGIFSLATDDPESLRIAVELEAPVVTGMLTGIKGTSLHFFNTESLGVETTPVVFESGQHDEPLSVNRAIAAITNCMKIIGSIEPGVVENQHNHLLETYSADLPSVTRLVASHPLKPQDGFKMQPNYQNFQVVRAGELLATDASGDIISPADGRILMPLYQEQGEDGFFIVEEVEEY
jgi:succinylglutamate desuccinylase